MHQFYAVWRILRILERRAEAQGEDEILRKIKEAEELANVSTRPFDDKEYLNEYSLSGLAWMAGAMTALLVKVEEILQLCAGDPDLLQEGERHHLAVVVPDLIKVRES